MTHDSVDQRLRQLMGEIVSIAPEPPSFDTSGTEGARTRASGPRRSSLLVAAVAIVLGGLGLLWAMVGDSPQTVETADIVPAATTSTDPVASVAVDPAASQLVTGEGPARVVGPGGTTLYIMGESLPDSIDTSLADQIRSELMAMLALGQTPEDRREAIADGGLVVRVAIDLEAQQNASGALDDLPAGLEAVAVTVDNQTGDVVSAVSRSGTALTVPQPAGSARIVTYAAALEFGLNLQTVVDGTGPCEIETDTGLVTVENFGGSAGGMVLLSQQASRSSRCAEARLETLVGPTALNELLESLTGAELDGFIVDAPALTALEHVSAIATIANSGERPLIGFIADVTLSDGTVLFRRPDGQRVISAASAEALSELMRLSVERGTGTRAKLDGTVARGITGTDTDFQAAWFVGSSGRLSTAIWVALPNGEPMLAIEGRNVTGGSFPATAWARIHNAFPAAEEVEEPERPTETPCPSGFPVARDTDEDGVIDTCYRGTQNPTETESTERPTPVAEASCPSTHPVPDDINGDELNDACVTAGFTRFAPLADYATSISVEMQIGPAAEAKYLAATDGTENFRAGSITFIGTALSGTQSVELFRWYSADNNSPIALGQCFGSFSPRGGNSQCEQIDKPAIGASTGGTGPTREGGVETDPTWTYLLTDAPVGAAWFVIDTDTDARIIANVVGDVSIALWPSEAGAPDHIAVLDSDHIELWSLTVES